MKMKKNEVVFRDTFKSLFMVVLFGGATYFFVMLFLDNEGDFDWIIMTFAIFLSGITLLSIPWIFKPVVVVSDEGVKIARKLKGADFIPWSKVGSFEIKTKESVGPRVSKTKESWVVVQVKKSTEQYETKKLSKPNCENIVETMREFHSRSK